MKSTAKGHSKTKISMDDLKEIVSAYKASKHTAATLSWAFSGSNGWSSSCINRVRKVDDFDGEILLLCKLRPKIIGTEWPYKWRECSISDCKL